MQRWPVAVGAHRPRRHIRIGHPVDRHLFRWRDARFDQRQGFTRVSDLARELTGQGDGRAVSRGERCAVLGDDQEGAGGDERARREGEVGAVEPPIRQIERRDRGGVEQFDERSFRHGRVVHDFVDDDMVLRQIGRADERDVDGGSAANNESAIVIERTDRETVGSALEGDLNGPIGHGGPGDAIVRTVDLERIDVDGRGACQRDRIGARTEVSAAVAGDREIRGDRRQLLGKIIAALADPPDVRH